MNSPSTHIEAQIGNVSGGSQVAVGNYIVQIGRVEGGVVNILNEAPPPPRIRPQPVLLRPKPFASLIDRESETSNFIWALQSQQTVECTGQPGSGKTSLLRHMAHQSQLATTFPAGVVYFQVNQQSAADLLKSIFDAFYTTDFPIKPNETEIRHYLQSISALVLLDDVAIDPQQIEHLMNIAPNCTFVAVTQARSLLGESVEVPLKGLPTADAVRLFERELRRTLLSEEQNGARSICESVDCIPLLVLRAAHEAREKNSSLVEVVSESKLTTGDQRLAASQIQSSSEDEKKVLAALGVFIGVAVAAEHVAAVAGVKDTQQILDELEERKLVQSHEHRYTLASDVKAEQLGNQRHWFARAVTHFVNWTEEHGKDHKRITASGEAILLLLKGARKAQLWNEVKRLGHATEEALTVSGKWDMWATVLESLRAAAEAQGDVAERAWVLHQLGTRALCLGDSAFAKSALTDALGIREQLNDIIGAAVTRHNLNILGPSPQEPEDDKSTDDGGGISGPDPTPIWLKVGVIGLVGLAALTALVVWRFWNHKPVKPARIASFNVSPAAIPTGGQAQLCYEVENADRVRVEPNIGERKPATKECLNVTPGETLTYTLTAFAADGTTTSQQVTLNVEPSPVQAEIVQFSVQRRNGPGGANDVQFRLCYHVRNAAHAEIDNNGGSVVLNRPHCQQVTPQQTTTYTLSATGEDGRTVTRQAVADATKLPSPPPQILSFEAPARIIHGNSAELCFQLKDVSAAQIDPGARRVSVSAGRQCVKVTPLQNTTYTLRAFNSEGVEKSENRTIAVDLPPKPKHAQILFFNASPLQVQRGRSVKLCYGVADAQTTTIDPFRREFPNAGNHCFEHSPIESTTYTLSTKGEDGQTSTASATVKVEDPPVPPVRITRFAINPTLFKGTQICYGLENARSARIDPGVGVLSNLTSGCPRLPSREQQTYTLTATGADGKTVIEKVTYTPPEPPKELPIRIISFSGPSQQIKPKAQARLCYSTMGEGTAQITPQPGEVTPSLKRCVNVFPEKTTRYTLTVTGPQGQKSSRTITVAVEDQIIIR